MSSIIIQETAIGTFVFDTLTTSLHEFVLDFKIYDFCAGEDYDLSSILFQPTDKKFFNFLCSVVWDEMKDGAIFHLPYYFNTMFDGVNVRSISSIIEMLLLRSGVESNPGPVQSKFLAVSLSRDFRVNVNTQGILDLFTHGTQLPKNLSNFTNDFSSFVNKIPDRNFVETTLTSVKDNCSYLVNVVQNAVNKMESQMDVTCSTLNFSMGEARKFIFGILIVLVIWFALQKIGVLGTLGLTILGFAINYFGVFSNIKDCILDNGQTFWTWLGIGKIDVKTEGFNMDIANVLLTHGQSNTVFSAIFTSLFIYAVKRNPSTRDLEDLSRKIFNYQKGATSVLTIFDKASEMWSYLIEVISHKLGIEQSNGKINQWTLECRVNSWISQNEIIFKNGFGEIPNIDGSEISFDERKSRRAALMKQYNIGIDLINLGKYLDRKIAVVIQQWNQRINTKVTQMSTEAMNGEMRNPPTVMFLYGRSGVGKTSMCDGIKALVSAVISDVEGLERTSPANVYVRNSDMDHWDGYHAQSFVMFDDLGCQKDTEANPNKELSEIIHAKNCQPFPLKMAHLDDKGKFFTSQFIFCTTNIQNMASYVKSMTYPEAIVSRLSEIPFIVRVKPQYRRPMTPAEILALGSKQIHDQHYIDKRRTQYDVSDALVQEKFPNLDWTDANMCKFLTDEEFETIRPAEVKKCLDGTPQVVNYNVYYFEPLDISTGKSCGPPIEWPALCEIVEKTVRTRFTRGANLLKQQRDFHFSSLEDIKAGIISVRVQAGDDDDEDFRDIQNTREYDMDFLMLNKMFDASKPEVAKIINHWGPSFEQEYFERILALVPSTPVNELEESMLESLRRNWAQIWQDRVQYYEAIKAKVCSDPVIKTLKVGGLVLGWIALLVGITKGVDHLIEKMLPKELVDAKNVICKEIKDQTAHLPWWKRLFSTLGSPFNPVKISKNLIDLTPAQVFDIYSLYNLNYVNVEGADSSIQPKGANSRQTGRLKMRVPTMGFNVPEITAEINGNFKNVQVQGNEAETIIEFNENLIHQILVTVQSHQLTNDALSHVLPANSYMMEYCDKNGINCSIGNVTFLNDRAILFPYHYIQRMEHDVKFKKTLDDDCVFSFSRAPTNLELGKNAPANVMKCCYRNLHTFKRIQAKVFLDDIANMDKDAVICYMTGSGITGHNCSNIIKKFIKREDMKILCSSGLSGYLVTQRNLGPKSTQLKERIILGCSAITPVNILKRTGNRWFGDQIMDFQGNQPLKDENGKILNYHIILRDRYEYVANTRAGDCGSVLWIDHPQLTHCIVGMHSTDHPMEGKGCSVPITQEDINETLVKLGQCAVNAFEEPELKPLSEEDVFGVHQLVPQGNFQYIGKIVKDFPMQPIKTSILASPVQHNLHIMENLYSRQTGKQMNVEIKKTPATMRVHYENPENCRLYETRGEIYFQKTGEESRVCSLGDYNYWLECGGIKRDPLHEGLAKNSQHLPLIRESLIDNAVEHVSRKLLKIYNPLSVDAFSKAMAQNDFFITSNIQEQIEDVKSRNRLITDFIQNEWAGKKSKKFSMKETADKIIRSISLNKDELLILKKGLEMNYEGIDGMDDLMMDFASLSRYNEIQSLETNDPNPMILTIQQSVSGIDGDLTIRSINAKKSPGYPWCTQRRPYGKRYWVGKEVKCDGEGWKELEISVNKLIDEAKKKIPVVYFIDTMKDELRTHEKVKNFKTRIFSAGPMHFSIAFRMYFMRFLSHVMENKIDNESAIGINPYGIEWEKLAQHLGKFDGPTCIAGDYSNFDGSLNNQIMEKSLDVVEAFYQQYGSTQEEKTIRKNLWLCLTRSLHIGRDGGVYRWYNSQPSGNPYTTMINVMFNMIVFRIVYSLIFGKATLEEEKIIFPSGYPFLGKPPKLGLASFEDNVRFIAYGDDNCANINPEIIDWFNMHTISRAMKILGLTYTDEFKNKDGEMASARFLEEINFLKRAFKQTDMNGRHWIAPLDIDTVKEILMWVRSSDSVRRDETMIDNVLGTCLEMSLHGKEAYDDWIVYIQGMKHRNMLGDKFPAIETFYDQFVAVCNEEMDY